jgi:hypothetical protein
MYDTMSESPPLFTIEGESHVSAVIKDFSQHKPFRVTHHIIYVDDASTSPSRSLKNCIRGAGMSIYNTT